MKLLGQRMDDEKVEVWLARKIKEEACAEKLYRVLANPDGQEWGSNYSSLRESLRANKSLLKHFDEHADDEGRHKKMLVEILTSNKFPTQSLECKTDLVIHNTLPDVLMSIIYDEAEAAVEYVEGLDKHWVWLGQDINTRVKLIGIIVDELDHLSDTIIELKTMKGYEKFDPAVAEDMMESPKLRDKKDAWVKRRLWEKVCATYLGLYILARTKSGTEHLLDDTKTKIADIGKDGKPLEPSWAWRTVLDSKLNPTHGRGVFLLKPQSQNITNPITSENRSEDVKRYGEMGSVDYRDGRTVAAVLDEYAFQVKMDQNEKTMMGFVFSTKDALVELGPFKDWPTLVKEDDAEKIPEKDQDGEVPDIDRYSDVKPQQLFHKIVDASKKSSDYNSAIYMVEHNGSGFHFATQESLPELLIILRSNMKAPIRLSTVDEKFVVSF